jgi:predicted O-methyltransferase YrrM
MRTSYSNSELNYGDLLQSITYSIQPKNILEIGILDGYSLTQFISASNKNITIKAYDLFDEFNGNHADKPILENKFINNQNVSIEYGNFYDLHKDISDNTIDIIHIDIANNGDIFEYAIENYLSKLNNNGIMILEGGSIERDNVEWMKKYNKSPIYDVLQKYKETLEIKVFGNFPSITLIRK